MKLILLAGLFVSTHTIAQPDAKAIVEKSNEKVKALKSIHLNVTLIDKYIGEVSADIIISREKSYPVFGMSKVKMTGIAIVPTGSKTVSMVYDGNTFSYIDADKNESVVIENPTYSKIGRTGQLNYGMAIPAIYYEGFAFDSIIKYTVRYELLKDTVIFNRPVFSVYIVRSIYNEIQGETYQTGTAWYFDKESYLPLGNSFPGSNRYYKVKSVDKEFSSADFSLGVNGVIKRANQPTEEAEYLQLYSAAPDWTLPSNKVNPISLSKLRGKVVLLDFWGTWCAPCIKSMPAVQSIYEQFNNQAVEVIGVSVEQENAVNVPDFIKRKGFTYPIALDGKTISKDYKVTQFPTIYIVDKIGKIIFAGPGNELEKKKDELVQLIQKALLTD